MSLLSSLRDEALQLDEHELPDAEQVRPILGALVARLERLATQVGGPEDGLLADAPARPVVDHNQNVVQGEPLATPGPVGAPAQGLVREGIHDDTATVPDVVNPELAEARAKLAALQAQAEVDAVNKQIAELEAANSSSDAPAGAGAGPSQPAPAASADTSPAGA